MRVMLVTGSFPPLACGVGDYTRRLAGALAERAGMRVSILTSRLKEPPRESSFEVLPVMDSWRLKDAGSAIRAIRKWAPDIVHIQYPTQGYRDGFLPWLLPLIAFTTGRSVVQTWHESYARKRAPVLYLKAIVPSRVVVVRPNYREDLKPMLRPALWGKKTTLIPNASSIGKAALKPEERQSLRARYLAGQKRLIVFFGFVYPQRGVDKLFDIADAQTDRIVIAGEMGVDADYCQGIKRRADGPPWRNKVTFTGFLPPDDIAALLASADAVVLPYRTGGGEWNTGIHSAVLNRAFVLYTSLHPAGYDEKRNTYSARIDDVEEMQSALSKYAGRQRSHDADMDVPEWKNIAAAHESLYSEVVRR
jgi:glycosyltransferase involved in cell wall biosynthesis